MSIFCIGRIWTRDRDIGANSAIFLESRDYYQDFSLDGLLNQSSVIVLVTAGRKCLPLNCIHDLLMKISGAFYQMYVFMYISLTLLLSEVPLLGSRFVQKTSTPEAGF